MRKKHTNHPSGKDVRDILANCDLDGETFREIVEGRNPCLTIQELRKVADLACDGNGRELDEQSSTLLQRFQEHVVRNKCPDCHEFYEAILVTFKGASRAVERFVKSA